MKKYVPFKVIKEDAEEDKSIKMIKDLIDLDWEKDEDTQHQALAMIKGLVLADTKSAGKFLTDLSTYTSKMSIEDYSGKQEEGCKKKPKKKTDLKEVSIIKNDNDAQEAIFKAFSFLSQKYGCKHPKFYQNVSFAIAVGFRDIINFESPNLTDIDELQKVKIKNNILSKIYKSVKERI